MGLLYSLSNDFIGVQVRDERRNIPAANVVSITFDSPIPVVHPLTAEASAISSCITSLQKMSAATSVGINYLEYGRRLVDVATEVSAALNDAPEGQSRTEILNTINDYKAASTVWKISLDEGYDTIWVRNPSLFILLEAYGAPLKYSNDLGEAYIDRGVALTTIWVYAESRTEHLRATATALKNGTELKLKPILWSARTVEKVSSADITAHAIAIGTPTFTSLQKASRGQAIIPVEVIIDEKGNVIFAGNAVGPSYLIPSALRAARDSKFQPFTSDGMPVSVRGTIQFTLKP